MTAKIYGDELLFPLLLKPLSANVARQKIGLIQDLGKDIDPTKDPYEISQHPHLIMKKWNYLGIQSSRQTRKELQDFIDKHSPLCAHHDEPAPKVAVV